jgi:hypothetical protein
MITRALWAQASRLYLSAVPGKKERLTVPESHPTDNRKLLLGEGRVQIEKLDNKVKPRRALVATTISIGSVDDLP